MSMTESKREEILSDIRDGYIDEWDNLTIDELFKQIESEHKEVQQYRAIGTVSEFRELKEKATAKKPIPVDSGVYDYDFDFVCPNCGENVDDIYIYCDCGQKLDWNKGKE